MSGLAPGSQYPDNDPIGFCKPPLKPRPGISLVLGVELVRLVLDDALETFRHAGLRIASGELVVRGVNAFEFEEPVLRAVCSTS